MDPLLRKNEYKAPTPHGNFNVMRKQDLSQPQSQTLDLVDGYDKEGGPGRER